MAHPRRNASRLLAPLALIVGVIAVIVVLSSSGVQDKKPSRAGGRGASGQTSKTKAPATPPRRSYTIKVGDTLGAIAERTGVPVAKLQELNPALDPQNLVAGQKIKLRE